MIASVSGPVLRTHSDRVHIDIHGVGLLVFTTAASAASTRVGHNAQFFTSLVVREDSLTLYGFATDEEREVFEVLQSVSGIGPKLALTILDVHSPDALRTAIEQEDIAALRRIPGVGPKSAQRLVLELKGKLGPAPARLPQEDGSGNQSDHTSQVLDGLVGLGWNLRDAESALSEVKQTAQVTEVSFDEVPKFLRAALRALGARRG